MRVVRTRFAPSPTGRLHIGGVRTALFEILFAHRNEGKAILRIEDTDRERLVPGAIQGLLEDFAWLGLQFDEGPSPEDLTHAEPGSSVALGIGGPYGPYVQSLRLPRYREVAELLVQKGAAYRCDCSRERLEREREEQAARKEPPGYSGYCRDREVPSNVPHVIRFRIPSDRAMVLQDAVKGEIAWDRISLRDTVLLKSDGFPTYHLASVVDDHDMQISHVLRADEWVSTTPLHLLLYEAMNWEAPVIGHLPPVMGMDGKKLSKRHGAMHVGAFREEGYLPEALINFLALLGWAPGDGQQEEILSLADMTRMFSLDHVNVAGGVFSFQKLKWMNGVYIRRLSVDDLAARIRPFLEAAGLAVDDERFSKIVPHIQERIELLKDAVPLIDFLFRDRIELDMNSLLKTLDAESSLHVLEAAEAALRSATDFTAEQIESKLRAVPAQIGMPAGAVLMVMRLAVTGKKITPPLFQSIYAMGRELSVRRLQEACAVVRAASSSPVSAASPEK